VTEAGFGADLGAEKFLNLKSRAGGLKPSVAVLVATVRALKYHGGVALTDLGTPNPEAVVRGSANMAKHIENLQSFGLPVVVAINAFAADTQEEQNAIRSAAASYGVQAVLSEGWAHGGAGTEDLARAVVAASKGPVQPKFTYELTDPMEVKIRKIATKIYGADDVVFAPAAKAAMKRMGEIGLGDLPVCMAKTQKSFSDDEKKIGRPSGFNVTVRGLEVSAGAGFVVPLLGDMLRMPGLPEVPAAEQMRIDGSGWIEGLS
jgi:formate--tetrahydrofolate ligase